MIFGEPWRLWALAGVGGFALVLVLLAISQRTTVGPGRGVRWPRIARVVASGAGVRPVRAGHSVRRPWLLLLALSGVIGALAYPRWGKIEEPIVEQAREVIIALDLSRSMLVADVPPSRLDRGKLLTKSLLDNLRGERIGIIVFAGTAFVQVPLSADYQIIHDFLPELKPDYMPQGGTDYDGMLRAALGAFGEEANVDRFLIVLSDGESHATQWREHLPALRERGVRALTLGVGTAAGGFISDGDNGYLKDERGAVVLSKLEPATLQALAQETRGVFRNASEWVDLAALLEATVARGQAGKFATRRNERHLERFQWFLAPAVALALLGLWREIAVRPRQQTVRPHMTSPTRSATTTTVVATALALMLFAPCLSEGAESPPAADAAEARVRETITRLASSPAPTARDWRELADRTLVYATGARMNQQTVEAGAVHDALAAVDRGEKANPTLTDWNKLRNDLRATLDLPPQPEKPEQKPDEPPPKEQPKNEDQKQQEQDQQNESQDPSSEQQQEQKQEQPSPSEPQDQKSGDQNEKKPAEPKPNEGGAMGDMKPESGEPPPAPPKPEASASSPPKTRKVGAKPPNDQPPPADAESAMMLQRLRQAAENDSPARLFQLMEGDEKQPAERGKDW